MPSDLIVTGASGKLGRMLRPLWPDAHWLSRGDAWPEGRGGVILNLAGVTDPNGPLEDNVTTAARAIDEGARRGARVFLMSSVAVYGAGDFAETDEPAPLNAYGRAKLRMEALPGAATILRLGNVAGADALLGRAGAEVVLDPVDPVRSYIGPVTLARVLRAVMAAQDLPRILNIAEPPPVAMSALLDAAGIAWRFGPDRPGVVARVGVSTDRLDAICPLPPADPARMVAEWRQVCPR